MIQCGLGNMKQFTDGNKNSKLHRKIGTSVTEFTASYTRKQ